MIAVAEQGPEQHLTSPAVEYSMELVCKHSVLIMETWLFCVVVVIA